MATSLALTRDDFIKAALRRIGALGQGETPTTNEIDEAVPVLNSIIKEFDSFTNFKWFIKSANSTVAAAIGTNSYNLAADVQWVESVVYNDGTFDYPLEQLTVGEYAGIQNKTRQGTPTHYFISTDLSTPKLYVYFTPYQTGTFKYWYRRKTDIFDNSSDVLDLPQEWTRAIVLMLTADLSAEYGKPIQDQTFYYTLAEQAIQRAIRNQDTQLTGQEVTRPSLEINNPFDNVRKARLDAGQ